jgi:hypothetical protein
VTARQAALQRRLGTADAVVLGLVGMLAYTATAPRRARMTP